jgi:hypothetical protein
LVKLLPILDPISTIEISTPRLKEVIPSINKNAPIKKEGIKEINELSKETILIPKIINVIGSIDLTDDKNCSKNNFFILTSII